MHELTLCRNMVEIIEREAVSQSFQRVETVRMEIGVLSCVEPESLRFCFGTVTRGTVAEGARLEIAVTPAEARCRECGAESAVDQWGTACQACGSHRLDLCGGNRIRIKDMEVH